MAVTVIVRRDVEGSASAGRVGGDWRSGRSSVHVIVTGLRLIREIELILLIRRQAAGGVARRRFVCGRVGNRDVRVRDSVRERQRRRCDARQRCQSGSSDAVVKRQPHAPNVARGRESATAGR
jgi:hypothetical protein